MERAQMVKVSEALGQSMDFLFRDEGNQSSNGLVLQSPRSHYPSLSRRVILNPEFQPPKKSADTEKIRRHFESWMAAAERSEDTASYLYTQLKLHLPLSHLERLSEDDPD